MLFTVGEMEILCVFYEGTRKATLEALRSAAAEMKGIEFPKKKEAAESAIRKLEAMSDTDTIVLAFEDK